MLGRWGMFVLWCLVLWGTLWDLALLRLALTEGASAAAAAALRIPAKDAAEAWGNRLCGLIAVFGWVVALGGRWASSRRTA